MLTLCDKYLQQATTCLRQERLEESLRALNAVLHLEPFHPQAIELKVQLFRRKAAYESAAECLQEALAAREPQNRWVLELADLLINRLQRPLRALDWLGRLPDRTLSDQERQRSSLLMAEALVDCEQTKEALNLLAAANRRYPQNEELLFLAGWVALQREEFPVAVTTFQELSRCNPYHADAHYYLGMAYEGLGEYSLMRGQFMTTYELDLRNPPLLVYGHRDFDSMARQALREGQEDPNHDVRLEVRSYPSEQILLDFPYDPRRMARLFSYPEESGDNEKERLLLVLYQWNLERMNFSEDEMKEELRQIVRHELLQTQIRAPLSQKTS